MKVIFQYGGPALFLLGLVLVIVFRPARDAGSAGATDWTCSMHPQIHQPKPGKCPICGMDLVPVSQATQEKERIEKRAGIITEPVAYRDVFKEVRTVGKLDFNERQVAYITARISGRVDRVYADFTGIPVKKNDHLVDIYSPELYVAQSELIRAVQARKNAKQTPGTFEQGLAENTLESARLKLRLLGILPDQLKEIEDSLTIKTHLTIYAPMGGTVIEKSVRSGQYVKEGDVLYRIADLDPIWLYLDIYESDLGWVRFGQKVDVTVEAYPGEKFPGIVTFIDPFLEDKTRTVKARVNLANPNKKLKPAMYASVSIRAGLRPDGTPEPTGLEGKYLCPMHPEVVRDKPGKCPICEMTLERVPDLPPLKGHAKEANKVVAIRTSAVLDTGRRKVTYRQNKDGNFELIDLQVGPRAEGKDDQGKPTTYYPVLAGVKEGERVVVQGGFLLDSQRQIEGMPSLLFPQGASGVDPHAGHGGAAPKPSQEHKH